MSARDTRHQAAVVEAGRLLLLHCVPSGEAGFWVLPGGGREAGESAEACVAREVREEAGVDVAVGPLLYEAPAEPPDGTYSRWRTYLCRITRGEPAPGGGEGGAELTAVRWLPLAEPASWEPALREDPFLHPQLLRISAALREPAAGVAPPAVRPTPTDATHDPPHTGVSRMELDGYEYRIEVGPAAAIAGGRYGFVAAIVDLRRRHADGTIERFASPFGQYHGENAAEAEARAREGIARWVEAQRGR